MRLYIKNYLAKRYLISAHIMADHPNTNAVQGTEKGTNLLENRVYTTSSTLARQSMKITSYMFHIYTCLYYKRNEIPIS